MWVTNINILMTIDLDDGISNNICWIPFNMLNVRSTQNLSFKLVPTKIKIV